MAWNREDYFITSLEDKPIRDVRKEYTRFRKMFNKHLKAGFGQWYENVAFRINPYPTIKELSSGKSADESNNIIRHFLSEMKNLSLSRGYTAAGRRQMQQDAIETLHSRGATSINSRNFGQFIKFAAHFQDTYGIKYTTDALTVFDTVLKNKGNLDQMYDKFEDYLSNIEQIEKIRKLPRAKQRKALEEFEIEV